VARSPRGVADRKAAHLRSATDNQTSGWGFGTAPAPRMRHPDRKGIGSIAGDAASSIQMG